MEKISIIIPVYNVENYLEECLESIVNQSYKNLEIIIVNDGSQDRSIDIMNKYCKKDKRIKIINKKNGGLSSARNEGILNATGDFIFHIDGDDFINNFSCEKLIKRANRDNLDMVIGNIRVFNENKEIIWEDNQMGRNEVIDGRDYLKKYFFLGKGTNSVCNKLIKRELYISEKIMHPFNISLGEDGATLPRLILKSLRIGKVEETVYNYRYNRESMTRKRNKKIQEYRKAFEVVKDYFYKNNEKNFFDEYNFIFKYNLYYSEVMAIPFKIAEKENLQDYLTGWEELKKEIKLILKDKFIKKLSLKRKILLIIYKNNIRLGDIVQMLWYRFLSKK